MPLSSIWHVILIWHVIFMKLLALPALILMACLSALPAAALELVMIDRAGCGYCIAWKRDIGPAYPNTEMGQYAPLRTVDIGAIKAAGIETAGRVLFTPTFLLIEDGKELGRIEGNPGEDFFWHMLHQLLSRTTDYRGAS